MPTQQIQNDPIYSLPHLYISGMNISIASGTVIAIAPGQARDMNDNIDMPVGFPDLQGNTYPPILNLNYMTPLFLNSATNGANGLDSGTLAASSNYAIWLIGDSRGYKKVAGLISSISNAYPLLPAGYDSLRLIGFANTGGGSTFTSVLNAVNLKAFYLQPPVSVLAGGNATTFTAINLGAAVPTTTQQDVIIFLNVTFTPAAVGDSVSFRNSGSTATENLPSITGLLPGIPQQQYLQVIAGVSGGNPSIDYVVASSSDSVNVSVSGYAFTSS